MKHSSLYRILSLILPVLFVIVCLFFGDARSELKGNRTSAEVQEFVDKAVAYARTHPKNDALSAFSAKTGEFNKGDLYIFAYDFSGKVLAHGGDQSLIGKNLLKMTDPTGVAVISELVRIARQGSGWLYYTWPNPEHAGRQEPKNGYVVKIDENWFIGSGAYGSAEQNR
ncbi:MAG: hypothetical protein HGA97_10785 [Chlorobiaceae bacterium]|nr:hypothetical protein [Chlorobiaceae bacterium]